jgi:hypothetical protein
MEIYGRSAGVAPHILNLGIRYWYLYLYLFQIPSNLYTGQRTSHKPQDIESVITIQYKMFQQKNVST